MTRLDHDVWLVQVVCLECRLLQLNGLGNPGRVLGCVACGHEVGIYAPPKLRLAT